MPRTKPSEHKFNMAMAATIKAARMKRALTQAELAVRLNWEVWHVSRVERGIKGCTFHTLRRLAFGLQTEAWILLRSAEMRYTAAGRKPVVSVAAASSERNIAA